MFMLLTHILIQWFREHGYLEHGKYNSLDDWIRDEWEGGYVRRWDANDMIWLLNTWQMADISKVKAVNASQRGDLMGVLGSIKAKALIMPSKTDLYFTVRMLCLDVFLFLTSILARRQ